MKLILGLLLLILSALGILYFRHYTGTVIPYPTLLHLLFFLLGILGFLMIFSSFKRDTKLSEDVFDKEIEKLKERSEKIELNFDLCEFHRGSYSHRVEDPDMSSVKWVMPSSMETFVDTTIMENVEQSYLVYNRNFGAGPKKYVSHYFPFDPDTLKFYVINNNITLYVDRADSKKYYFDLKR